LIRKTSNFVLKTLVYTFHCNKYLEHIVVSYVFIVFVLSTLGQTDWQKVTYSCEENCVYIQGEYKLSEDFAKQYFHKY
jgi:uncharacterized membrane protein YdbT with pleckstrin-like domain